MIEDFEKKLEEARENTSKGYRVIDWSTNWADEMDIFSNEVMTEAEYEFVVEFFEKIKDDFNEMYDEDGMCLYVGSNEDVYIDWGWIHSCLKNAKVATKEEVEVLQKFNCISGPIDSSRIFEDFQEDLYNREDNCRYEGM